MDYHFRPLGKTCSGSGQPLAPGSRVVSVLVDRDGDFVRLDYLAEAWPGEVDGALGQWHCVVPTPEPQRAAAVDPETMLACFEQLLEDANPGQEQLAYVLALFLLQRRRLKLDGSRGDGEIEYLQLSGSRGEGPFEVRDQQLSEGEITRLQAEVTVLLQSEWKAAG